MNKYRKNIIKWTLAALCLAPVLSWAHGALDTPQTRAMNCQVTGGFWPSTDGSAIVDRGCRESSTATFNTPAEWAFPAQQWNEVAHIPHINNPTIAQIQNIIKDGQICAVNDPRKASLDYPTPWWTKTVVQPGQPLTMRLIGTAPHVPSTFYPFVTRTGFNSATDVLKWSDLIPLGQPENLTVASTNWQKPPVISGASGFFLITRPIPSNASGGGLIVGVWVRDDPDGEFFISCSDVAFLGGGVPDPLTDIGAFINADMQVAKPGDKVHFRIFGSDSSKKELVDITQLLNSSNMGPGQWGEQIAVQVDPSVAKIGELNGSAVKFNPTDALINKVYVTNPSYTQAMSIIPGDGQTPVKPDAPIARISGPTSLKSGEAFTFSGTGSTGSNKPLVYQWAIPGLEGSQSGSTASGKAYNVVAPSVFTAELIVRDQQNGKTATASSKFTVTPGTGGGNHPPYVEGTDYKDGDIVSNNGKNYKCKSWPVTAWCAGAASYFEPGEGTNWTMAWDEVQ
ncbi:lytic polysaccharide monooxygenase [Pseudomonas sp. 18175]|uniref:lytic polysaccharide monooxygenase n=1 Tax=Pseudomonas sp. 18175 TaxID=3390056 RepID=UPI003D258929